MLRPIDVESLLEISPDAPAEGSPVEMFEGMLRRLGDDTRHPAIPTVWVQSARRHPALARAILLSTSGGSVRRRVREFSDRPHWQPILDTLHREALVTSSHDCHRASLARRLAVEFSSVHPEDAFWRALLHPLDASPSAPFDQLRQHRPADACRILAQNCLILASRPSTTDENAQGVHRWMVDAQKHIDVDRWVREAQELQRREEIVESEVDRQRLRRHVQLMASQQESHWRNLLLRVATRGTIREKMDVSVELLQDWFGSDWALWIPTGDASVGLARWMMPHNSGSMLGFHGPRDTFETQALPSRYRTARTIVSEQGRPVARLYRKQVRCPRHLQPWLTQWADAVATPTHLPHVVAEPCACDAGGDDEREKMIAEFSAGAGHEINNPLGAIGGHASFLLRSETDPDRRHAIAQIQTQVGRIKRMINDLQIIGGNYARDIERVGVDVILADALKEAEKRAPGGRASVQLGTDISLPGDRRWLARMLSEILLNGIQAAGASGFVQVEARNSSDGRAVEFIVTDSGRGFSAHDRRRAFLPFFSGRQAGRGLGMGLPVAQRIAGDHRGQVSIDFGLPTTVRVRLPLT